MCYLIGADSIWRHKQPVINLLKHYALPSLASKSREWESDFRKDIRYKTQRKRARTVLIGVSCDIKSEEVTIKQTNEQMMTNVQEVN